MLNLEKFFKENKLQFYPYRIFDVEKGKFIVTNTTSAIFELSKELEDVIQCEGKTINEVELFLHNKYSSEELEELLKELEKNYIIKTVENIEKFNGQLSAKLEIQSLTLMVCQECNLKCTYCYGDGGEYHDCGIMDLEIGKKAILFGLENCVKDSLSIIFFGGEPLMQFASIRQWVEFAKDEARKRSMRVGFSVTTNATLINNEIADFFKENHFGVTISIDGNESDNDKNRFYANGQGAYKNILKGVHTIQNHEVIASARGTVTSKNINMLASWRHLSGLKFVSIHLAPAINLMREIDLDLYMNEEKKMVDYFFECLKERNYESASKMHNIERHMLRIHNGGRRKACCGAQAKMIAIDKNGDIYPCHRFVSTKEMCIGNVEKGLDKNKISETGEALLLSRSNCSSCWAVVLCGGGCPFENYMENAVICKPNTFSCKANQSLLEYMMVKYLELSDEEKILYYDKEFAGEIKNEMEEAGL